MAGKITYKEAGVDIDSAEESLRRIKSLIGTTFNASTLSDIGSFGGLFELDTAAFKKPVLVSSTDGVGTKLKVAIATNRHDTIGECLVNHCVNDILTCGARPLFFLDYLGLGKVEPAVITNIVEGLVRGCKNNGCVLIGGETAEMPGLYQRGDYDIAGTIVGIVEKEKIVSGSAIQKGDVLFGLASTGLHTNGYSLARKVLLDRFQTSDRVDALGDTVGNALLAVHRSYLDTVTTVMEKLPIKGMAHITGGGLLGNTGRIIPEGCSLNIDWTAWPVPPIFTLIQETGDIDEAEMRRAFNLGIGFVLIVAKEHSDMLSKLLQRLNETFRRIGEVT